MIKKTDTSTPKKGMNRNSHPSEVSSTEYTFALNANVQEGHGDGDLIIVNEPSNLKCSGFKEGYSVVKHKFDRVTNKTYFFLVNPTTGCSEIGFINMNFSLEPTQVVTKECNCILSTVVEDGLENIIQEGLCVYNTIISDYCEELGTCTGCLGFSLNEPVTDVTIRHAISGDELYFTQVGKPQRYIKLDYIDKYFEDKDECTGEIIDVCLKCDDIRIFNLHSFPCIEANVIQLGGNLPSGIYEVAMAYSTIEGIEVTDYLAFTNYVSIIDYNNNILDQTSLDYRTNLGFSVDVNNIDLDYDFYKIVIIQRTGNNVEPVIIPYGIYSTSQSSFYVTSLTSIQNGGTVTLEKLLKRRIPYLTADGLADVGGYLFQHGLTQHREINLQPIVSLLGSFVKWGTSKSLEKLYKNGIASSKYKTYPREETFPLSITFKKRGGYRTPNFIFIARPPKASEIAQIDGGDTNYLSVTAAKDNCVDIDRNKVWQYYDTSEEEGTCPGANSTGTTETIEQTLSCIAEGHTITSGVIPEPVPAGIREWIEDNRASIETSTDPDLADIKDAITNNSYYTTCTPDFGGTCEEPTLVSSKIIVTAVNNQVDKEVSQPQSEYIQVLPPNTCERLVDPLAHDTVIENALPSGATVYKKITPLNTSCNSAEMLQNFVVGNAGVGFHLQDMASIGSKTPLLTNTPVTLTSSVFEPFLHSNAVYFQVQFLNSTSVIVELSQAICGLVDDNTSNSVRITVFDGCPVMTEKPSYGRIITNLTLPTDTNRFLVLDLADFTSNPYVVIDSPMRSDVEFDLNLSGVSGEATMDINGSIYTATYSTDINITINNFYSANSASWNTQGIISSISGSTIRMRMSEELYATIVFNTTDADLAFSKTFIEEYHTLQPPCGCFSAYRRDVIYRTVTTYGSITFGKEYVYKSTCSYTVQDIDSCNPIPYKYGKFSFCESTIKYPCNDELYDSSKVKIKPSDLLSTARNDFEDYYVAGGSANPQVDGLGNYVLTAQANFMDKPIRHYKFPSNIKAPFMSGFANSPSANSLSNNSIIYPIGFMLDNRLINDFLDIAVNNGYLSQEERDEITGYEIFRGDRTTERSVVAKGLLFNTLVYSDMSRNTEATYYQNYPLNDSSAVDKLNGEVSIKTANTMFTFQSPETSYENPTLTYELGIDGYQKGLSYNSFAPYKGHPKYSILGRKAKILASSLGGLEVVAEALGFASSMVVIGSAGGLSAPLGIAAAITAGVSFTLATLFRFGKYRYEWLNTFEKLGTGYNHAYVGLAEGQYFNFEPNTVGMSTLRGLEISSYLNTGNKRLTKETTGQQFFLNNFQREKSVFFKTQDVYPINYIGGLVDSSRMNIPTKATGKLGTYVNNTFSPYATMKQFIPNQYGEVNSIQWLSTGYCGDLDMSNECDIIYGGDTYITRHSVVRKFPFFTETAYNQEFDTPFKYSSYFNINNGITLNRGFIDFRTAEDTFTSGALLMPEIKTAFSLWNGSSWIRDGSNGEFFIKDDSKFLINYFGVPYFLVESEVNCWNRYAGVEDHENYYPNVDDTIEWLQEDRFGIREKETFRYNRIFSSRVLQKPTHMLPVNYSKEMWDKQDDLSNAVIYSQKDSNSSETRSPWLNYQALDTYRFSKDFGKLIDVRGIESDQILFRFTDGVSILGAIDQLRDKMTSNNSELGIGGIFTEKTVNFNKTDLGHGGTQHKTIVSTPFGHYWADAKRGKVFELKPNAKGMAEISLAMDKWFKEHLPFKILKTYPQVNVDRAYAGLGLSMGWDDRLKRVFLTKLDYIPKVTDLSYSEDKGFYIELEDDEIELISFEDENYFEKAHWTVAYSPMTKTWISYYSFTPNYYNSYTDYFQTGVNSIESKNGIWTHHPLFNSYQVFYGELYPFIIEEAVKTNATSSLFESMEFYLQVRRYYNYYDFTDIFGKGFNKAYIYNSFQNSGKLNLNFEQYNDLSQWDSYPKHNTDSIDILQSEIEGRWSFNYVYNHIKNEKSGLPIWINDNVQINKELNDSAMDYSNSWKDRLRGDYFLNRLVQDQFSQYKMFYRIGIKNIDYYNG